MGNQDFRSFHSGPLPTKKTFVTISEKLFLRLLIWKKIEKYLNNLVTLRKTPLNI